jgi:threonine aldolase
LVCLENTHNRCGGAPLSAEYTEQVAALAHGRGLLLHLDGARIFNAAIALGVDVKELTSHVDSLSFCLSKGLSAPVGSVICGSKQFVYEARRNRKALGGGMRQCGIIAAAGIEALEHMTERLAEDHDNAKRLARWIAEIPSLSIEPERVQTNIVFFDLAGDALSAEQLVAKLGDKGVKILQLGPSRLRAVTHYGIEAGDIDLALTALQQVTRR